MVRIQLDLPEDQVAELDRLMEETRLSTRKDLFNNALTLFMWAVKARRAGRIIASVDDRQNIRELVMPSIENITPEKKLQPSRA
jgi:metal-responsive CopG/Arc/MetJ family transcriptional regulator